LVLRTEHELGLDLKKKVALFCNVSIDAVIQSIDVSTIYEVPNKMREQRLDETVLRKMGLPLKDEPKLDDWNDFLNKLKKPTSEIEIGLVGKYVELQDAYKSIVEALIHAGATNLCKVKVRWIHSEKITSDNVEKKLEGLKGIIVAPGFGHRGIEGKIIATRYVREIMKNEYFQCSIVKISPAMIVTVNICYLTRSQCRIIVSISSNFSLIGKIRIFSKPMANKILKNGIVIAMSSMICISTNLRQPE